MSLSFWHNIENKIRDQTTEGEKLHIHVSVWGGRYSRLDNAFSDEYSESFDCYHRHEISFLSSYTFYLKNLN